MFKAPPERCRLLWLSDPHLAHVGPVGLETFIHKVAQQKADAIVITGNVAKSSTVEWSLNYLADAARCPVYFVLGSHDFHYGRVSDVLARVRELSFRDRRIQWLTERGPVSLTRTTALVGSESWPDVQLGLGEESSVDIPDFQAIHELAGRPQEERIQQLRRWASEAAERIEQQTRSALEKHRDVIIGTHVPPFEEAAWHQQTPTSPEYLPYFTSQVLGERIRRIASENPKKNFLVLAGRTRTPKRVQILSNLHVCIGKGEFGKAHIQSILTLH